ncbi:MAG: hypothetical protein ACOCSD_02360 [Halolamina sp.]
MTPGSLTALRRDSRRRLVVTVALVGVGLGLALVHWAGLLVAGALVALPQRSFLQGVAAGASFGVLVVVAFLAVFALAGTLGPVLAMGQPTWLAVGIGLGVPTVGSLSRGIV